MNSIAALKRMLVAALICSAAMIAAPASADIVVKSDGPSAVAYPAGMKLDPRAKITLKEGDSIVVLSDKGTYVLEGPGVFAIGARGTTRRSAFASLTRDRSTTRARTGAVRGGGVPAGDPSDGQNTDMMSRSSGAIPSGSAENIGRLEQLDAASRRPNLWYLTSTDGGTFCLPSVERIVFWRPDSSKGETITFNPGAGPTRSNSTGGEEPTTATTGGSEAAYQLSFGRGSLLARLNNDEFPIVEGASYSIGDDPETARELQFKVIENPASDPEALAEQLILHGCRTQLKVLSTALM